MIVLAGLVNCLGGLRFGSSGIVVIGLGGLVIGLGGLVIGLGGTVIG